MTEYWVSQGNKWCDFCKIYISHNPLSIRTHELGTRHKDNVAKRLDSMRKDNAAKDKEQKDAARALEQIEAKAKRSYQKDLEAVREVRETNSRALQDAHEDSSGRTELVAAPGGGNIKSIMFVSTVSKIICRLVAQDPSDTMRQEVAVSHHRSTRQLSVL